MRDRSPSDTARSGHHQRISATPPVFPSYLLPSFNFPFLRRRGRRPSSSSSTTTTTTTGRSLTRLAPDTLRCTGCSADLALSSQIVSKGFTGRYGRALLVAPPPSPSPDSAALLNIRLGRLENRQLVTGWHVVADISCGTCGRKLGWKYVDAREKSQRYKVGKYILETERVTTYRSWGEAGGGAGSVDDGSRRGGSDGDDDGGEEDDAAFDSADEDECDEVFAGTWDARAVARRRADMVAAAAAATRPDD